jgi:MFS family permease
MSSTTTLAGGPARASSWAHSGRDESSSPRGSSRSGSPSRRVLLAVVGLHLVAETALTPFLPQLFRTLFGVEDLAATGTFLWVCRVSGCLAFPLWGLAARRWPAERLVLTGLGASTVLYAALVFAPTYVAFTALSAAVVATNAALLLAYPALIATYARTAPRAAATTGEHLPGIRAYVAVFHAAVVVSTLVGAAVIALPNPRWGLVVFVAVGGALLLLCRRSVGAQTLTHPPTRGTTTARGRIAPRHLAAVAAVAVVFEVGTNVVRPFFTEYAATGGLGTIAGAVQFLLASAAALAVLPFAGSAARLLGRWLLPLGLAVAAAGLLVQALGPDLATLTVGRLVFGVGLGLGHVALDLRMFAVTGTSAPAYAAVQTARIGGLFLSPLLATVAATHDLALPLVVGALLYLAGAALAPRLIAHPTPRRHPAHGSHR